MFLRCWHCRANMKTKGEEILRWTAIAVFGGFGAWVLLYGGYSVIIRSNVNWPAAFFPLGFLVLLASPFLAVAYICFRRQYRELFSVLGVVGAIVVFEVLISMPFHWHVLDSLAGLTEKSPVFAFLGLPVSLLCLFAPFYGATWFYRFCHRLAQPPILQSSEPPVIGAARGS